MAGPAEQRWYDLAEEAFVFKGQTYDQVIDQIQALGGSISKASLCAWNKKGDWSAKRERYLKSRSGVAGQLQALLDKRLALMLTESGDLSGEQLRDLVKLMTAIEKFDKAGPDLKTMTAEVMGHFVRYCREHCQPGELDVLRRHVGGFLSTVEMAA